MTCTPTFTASNSDSRYNVSFCIMGLVIHLPDLLVPAQVITDIAFIPEISRFQSDSRSAIKLSLSKNTQVTNPLAVLCHMFTVYHFLTFTNITTGVLSVLLSIYIIHPIYVKSPDTAVSTTGICSQISEQSRIWFVHAGVHETVTAPP